MLDQASNRIEIIKGSQPIRKAVATIDDVTIVRLYILFLPVFEMTDPIAICCRFQSFQYVARCSIATRAIKPITDSAQIVTGILSNKSGVEKQSPSYACGIRMWNKAIAAL